MVKSFTLVRVKPHRDKDVYGRITQFHEVKGVNVTYGEYDLIVEIDVSSLNELDSFIFNKLRAIEGVESTTTLIEASPPEIKKEQ
jgi:DNA-binding Lrp family transcriptional regulator